MPREVPINRVVVSEGYISRRCHRHIEPIAVVYLVWNTARICSKSGASPKIMVSIAR